MRFACGRESCAHCHGHGIADTHLAWRAAANRRSYILSGSAFTRNAMAEMSKLLGEHSPTVIIVMWKCFGAVQ
eukprot:7178647-Pyramimonas_sp.AAC.1